MPFCLYQDCENYTEGTTYFCATHNAMYRKAKRDALKVRVVSPIRKVSEKRKNENKVYGVLREAYLKTHYYCQIKLFGCTHKATEIHHVKPREGKGLTDITSFRAACHNCHSLLHNKLSAKERREKNLLI